MAKRRPAPSPASSQRPELSQRAADTPRVALLNGVELSELRQLIRLVQRTGIGELEVSSGGRTVRISATAGFHRNGPGRHDGGSRGGRAGQDTERASGDGDVEHGGDHFSHGRTFYRAPARTPILT